MHTFRNIALTLATLTSTLIAEPIAVRQTQGLTHGFLIVRAEDGRVIARGELSQVAHGERVTAHLTYRFRDGSIDEDTAIFTQRGTFQLVSDHHIQKGPYFPRATDYLIDVASGNVTSRSIDKDGKEKVEVERMDLPADIANGIILTDLLNVTSDTPAFKIGMVAPTGKGRLVKLAIVPEGESTFYDVGTAHKATIFRVKIELGGLEGVIAPIVGKEPKDTMVWIIEGEAPGFIRQVGQIYEGGPVVSIELSGTSFSRSAPRKSKS
jgi:hypothetical protein